MRVTDTLFYVRFWLKACNAAGMFSSSFTLTCVQFKDKLYTFKVGNIRLYHNIFTSKHAFNCNRLCTQIY